MKPPTGPFWAWSNIGRGWKWHLCYVAMDEIHQALMIRYVTEDFDDFWDEDYWKPENIVPIEPPPPKPPKQRKESLN